MRKTERRLPRGRARSGREPLRQRGHASTGLSTARIARCVVLVHTVVSALNARSAVGREYASTDVGALSARSAVGLQSASTVVGALCARSAVGHQSASTVVSALGARSAVGVQSASTVVYALCARSAVGDQSASTVVSAISVRSARSNSHHDSMILAKRSKAFQYTPTKFAPPNLSRGLLRRHLDLADSPREERRLLH